MGGSVRADVHYFGYVQGVGFRYSARQTAAGHDVSGYVQNLPDGSVRVVAEGARPEVDAFLAALAEEMGSYVDRTDVQWHPATGEFAGFNVRF
jgi:acylphosphatase